MSCTALPDWMQGRAKPFIMYDEKNADLLLMDERKGRSIAKQLRVKYIGTAGILMLAYDKGHIGQAGLSGCHDSQPYQAG